MIVIDASVWVSVLLLADVHHGVSRQWYHSWSDNGGELIAPSLFLAEVAGAVGRRMLNVELANDAVDDLLVYSTVRLVELEAHVVEAAARIAAAHRIRGADATYVAVAREQNLPLVTWDRELLERAGDIVTVLTPEDLMPAGSP